MQLSAKVVNGLNVNYYLRKLHPSRWLGSEYTSNWNPIWQVFLNISNCYEPTYFLKKCLDSVHHKNFIMEILQLPEKV